MGCHTWFAKPVNNEEFDFFRKQAIKDAWLLHGETTENKIFDYVDLYMFNKVKESVVKNTDFWWKHGYGTRIGSQHEFVFLINKKLYMDVSDSGVCHNIFNLKRFHDVFRLKNYPSKIIHSRRELRRWMGKKYFKLNQYQLEVISDFFKTYPGGIITFG